MGYIQGLCTSNWAQFLPCSSSEQEISSLKKLQFPVLLSPHWPWFCAVDVLCHCIIYSLLSNSQGRHTVCFQYINEVTSQQSMLFFLFLSLTLLSLQSVLALFLVFFPALRFVIVFLLTKVSCCPCSLGDYLQSWIPALTRDSLSS